MSTNQNRLGFHYYPDQDHYTEVDLSAWMPTLVEHNVSWLTLPTSIDFIIPEYFIRSLLAEGVTPVIHVSLPIQPIRKPDLLMMLGTYHGWGVRNVVVYDRPNLRTSWPASEWNRGNPVAQFVERFEPVLRAQYELGMTPIFPPLQPGGDYWDTAFLETALDSLASRVESKIIHQMNVGLYCWTFGRPLSWGQGGHAAWPESRPYHTPEGSQDQLGLNIYDWYSEIIERIIGTELPMLVLAGGAKLDGNSPNSYVETQRGILRMIQENEMPDAVQNFCFYLLSSDPAHPDKDSVWFHSPGNPTNTTQQIFSVNSSSTKVPVAHKVSKPIAHYVMLPARSGRDIAQDWSNLAPFALAVKPVIGFSVQEAMLARRVSLIGDEESIPNSIEVILREADCEVHRFNDSNGEALLRAVADNVSPNPVEGAHHA